MRWWSRMAWWLRAALLLGVLAFGGLLVAASGVISVAASGGHFRVTAWLLHFAMQRSVATHTIGDEAPALAEPGLVLKGAGHYELGCRPCHGRPNEDAPAVAQAMTPAPPTLGAATVAKWEPEELVYIVEHGVKFTGMPAWPAARRDDEVRAVAAFVLASAELDAAGYERLVFGDAVDATTLAGRACARCHGVDGCGRGSAAFPRLAGQSREYLEEAMHAYVDRARPSGIMAVAMGTVDRAEFAGLADHYARMPGCAASGDAADAGFGRGQAVAHAPDRRIPSCEDCHGPVARGRNPAMPGLAGQPAEYLELQLELFRRGDRGGGGFAHLMTPVVRDLSPAQIADVAAYYAALGE